MYIVDNRLTMSLWHVYFTYNVYFTLIVCIELALPDEVSITAYTIIHTVHTVILSLLENGQNFMQKLFDFCINEGIFD